jgi:transposase
MVSGAMHIEAVPNRGARPTYLLRQSVRDGKRVRKRTLANLTALPDAQIETIRRALKGETLVPASGAFECLRSQSHGAVQAVRTAMKQLGLETLIASRPSRLRDLVVGMIAMRIVSPEASKLGMIPALANTTLPDDLGVADADEDELYEAMDWLVARQDKIEKKLAKRHLRNGGLVLFDLTSSYFEGETCPLAQRGYSRDRKSGTLQVNYGLLTDERGCPVSVSAFEGNVADPKTLLPQVEKTRKSFGIDKLVMVGDRGMISNVQIDAMRSTPGIDWITALKSGAIATLLDDKTLQPDLFDERNLMSISHPDYPGERLIACRNPALASRRAKKRDDLIAATAEKLGTVKAMVEAGRLKGAARIGVRVGKVVARHKVEKHFDLTITDASFEFAVSKARVAEEAALDGIYVIRTSVPDDAMTSEQAVLSYKRLADVERAFRTMKGMDQHVRPIRHRLEGRVRAHLFLCMLAYYVQWHMIEAWSEWTYKDDEPAGPDRERDPVSPAKRSKVALAKAHTRTLADGTRTLSFGQLLDHLGTIVRNTLRPAGARPGEATFTLTTTPNPKQARALELLAAITP